MEQQLEFLREIDKLKSVHRKTPLLDQSRVENSAEHSWHLAMYALVLSEYANENIDVDRVVRMLLIHDIVEIDAGDHPIHDGVDTALQEAKEVKAASRLFGLLPTNQAESMHNLWREFELGESPDAAFAKSLDRLQPLLHNISTGGGTWLEADVSKQQVFERYGNCIEKGSSSLWSKAKSFVEEHFKQTRAR